MESSSPKRAGLVLAALILVAAVANLNLAVANVALPSIGQAFGSSQTALDLIAVGYSLGLAASVLYLGAVGDRHGRKMMLVLGTVLAIPSSLLAAFAPTDTVLVIARAADYEEALRMASEHEYGNGVAIFTRDGDAARDFAARVEVGMVGVNVPIPVPIAYHTFGGWKKSGFGDLNQHGPDAFRFYTKTKTVTSRWPSGIKEGASFVIPTMH